MFRLRELRKEKKLTQQELSKMLSVTQATLSGWETEKYQIDIANLIKCAKFFDVSIDYLLGNSDEKHRNILLNEINDTVPDYEGEKFQTSFHVPTSNESIIEKVVKFLDANSIQYEKSIIADDSLDKTSSLIETPQFKEAPPVQPIYLNGHILTETEKQVILQYRNNPQMQTAVNTLLGVQADNDYYIPVAARNGNGGKVKVTSSEEERKAALDKVLPGVSTPKEPDKF